MQRLSYEERLAKLGLFILEWKGDLSEDNTTIRDIDQVESSKRFPIAEVSIIRGHGFKVRTNWSRERRMLENCWNLE